MTVGCYSGEVWLDRGTLLPAVEPPTWLIGCVGCPRRSRVPRGGIPQAQAQVELWCAGWRRDPDSGRDYCPDCAASMGAA